MQQDKPPTQKFGYIDIKQSSKVRGRKLKSWRRRWVVLTLLNDLSRGGQPLAKLDIYDNEAKWRQDSGERMTFVLEDITSIRHAVSKTHAHAIEIVGRQPMLVLSGSSEVESYGWMLALRQMLVPSQADLKKCTYQVSVMPNTHSARCGLSGVYTMHVTPRGIDLVNMTGTSVINWGLSTLVRFNIEDDTALVIECGPNSPTGQSIFKLSCGEAKDALAAIRQCICMALLNKQTARKKQEQSPRQQQQLQQQQHKQQQQQEHQPQLPPPRDSTRNRSTSATVSEKGFLGLLDAFPRSSVTLDRSDSDSSGTSISTQTRTLTSSLSVCSDPLTPPVTPRVTSPFSHNPILARLSPGGDSTYNTGSLYTAAGGGLPGRVDIASSGPSVTDSVNYTTIAATLTTNTINTNQLWDNQLEVVAKTMMALNQNVGAAPGSHQTESSSPTIRPKRSSDNLRIPTPELEVVPEKDENSASTSGGGLGLPPPTITPSPITSVPFGSSFPSPSSTSSVVNASAAESKNNTSTPTITASVVSTQVLVELFDDLIVPETLRHRRYSSLPATKDGGYSVIKEIDSNGEPRERRVRASTMDGSACSMNSEQMVIESEMTKPSSLQDVNGKSIIHTPLPPPPSQDEVGQANGKTTSKNDGGYQEIDKKEDPYKAVGGRMCRRRSSSLSDLSVVRHVGSKAPHFENVYEDVEDLKEAVRMLNRLAEKEEPPELPARPTSLSFSNNKAKAGAETDEKPRASTDGTPVNSQKKKKSFFNKSRGSSSIDSGYSELDVRRPSASSPGRVNKCICLDADKKKSIGLTCIHCGGVVSRRSSHKLSASSGFVSTTSSTEDLINHPSVLSGTYADIAEMREALSRRRRSSDITPVAKSFLDLGDRVEISDNQDTLAVPPTPLALKSSFTSPKSLLSETEEPKPPALPRRRSPTLKSKPQQESIGDLIQLSDFTPPPTPTKNSTRSTPNTETRAAPQGPPPGTNPLISFFFDDSSFQSHPMVTGQLTSSPQTAIRDLLTPAVEVTPPTPVTHFPNGIFSNIKHPPVSFPSQSVSHQLDNNNNFDYSSSGSESGSQIDQIGKGLNFNTSGRRQASLNFVNPFTDDMSLWNQMEISTSPPKYIFDDAVLSNPSEGNYHTMTHKPPVGRTRSNDSHFPKQNDQDNVYMSFERNLNLKSI